MTQQQTPWLQQILESIWYGNGFLNTIGKYLLLPLSALFCLIASYKKKHQIAAQQSVNIPVIVVGNISLGGTGKTPLVIKLAELLTIAGYKPCIITRGYKSNASHYPLLVDTQVSAKNAGDEAKLMANRTNLPVIVGADRLKDIHHAMNHGDCNIILSDDGMQHYRMQRDLEIAVIDAERGFGNGYCLPAGPLRERIKRLESCDFVMINGDSSASLEDINTLRIKTTQMQLKGSSLINVNSLNHDEGEEKNKKALHDFDSVQVITGIGNPKRFTNTLEHYGLNIIKQTHFPDHHHFVNTDFNLNMQIPIVMTEKDAVKCAELGLRNCWYFPVDAELEESFELDFTNKVSEVFNQAK